MNASRPKAWAASRAGWVMACCLALSIGGEHVAAQIKQRIIDQPPYDLVTLKENQGQFKLQPLEGDNRRPLANLDNEFKLQVRLWNRPQQPYQIAWKNIAEFKLFEQLVLEEAASLVAAEEFEDAYEYYRFLEQRDADFPGLAEAKTACLFAEARLWQRRGRPAQALALFHEVHRRDPRYQDLREGLGESVEALVQQDIQLERYVAARKLLAELDQKFPAHQVVENMQGRLIELAKTTLEEAQSLHDENRMREAYQVARSAVQTWPAIEGGVPLLELIHQQHPVVTVGVRQAAEDRDAWPNRRVARLTQLQLVDPVGFDQAGGTYQSRVLSIERNQSVLLLGLPDAAATQQYVALLRGLAVDRQNPSAVLWSQLLQEIAIGENNEIQLQFKSAFPWLESLLTPALAPASVVVNQSDPPLLGPYQQQTMEDGGTLFQLVRADAEAGQPREIIERVFGSPLAAGRALRDAEIVAWDRVGPWEKGFLTSYDGVRLEPYAWPTVQYLVPNLDRPVMADGDLRRALLLALDRQTGLGKLFADEASPASDDPPADATVLPGPFPVGYATEAAANQDTFQPQLATLMVQLAWQRLRVYDAQLPQRPTLTLMAPTSPAADRTVQWLEQQLLRTGITLVLVEPESTSAADLLLVEWYGMEPAVDVFRIFSEQTRARSPEIWEALGQLAGATTTEDAGARLREISRVARQQAWLIPLWQFQEYVAYRESLQNLGTRPVTLYQSVEQWRHPAFVDPSTAP